MRNLLKLLLFAAAIANSFASDWPQWRGLYRDGHSLENLPKLNKLPEPGNAIWKKSIGGGFSSPVIAKGKLVFLDESRGKEYAHCLDAKTGSQLWEPVLGNSLRR